ncbi:hypothetical protein OV203_11285 [Nannocystis sp. ILAH1]|uniref:hypothetical protein n=1 Tax=unclassified Nannocystis TaxID=2627009 RepID=UPI00226E95C3|nr:MULTISPECIES: hypothetical protein [unclassified Nannocystis]MCY0987711.1 hypothetical protein [Nannocystis sp. ILAH1]MCY1070489.1 hypothetical protein [Nannocystis sp. RBIL2]
MAQVELRMSHGTCAPAQRIERVTLPAAMSELRLSVALRLHITQSAMSRNLAQLPELLSSSAARRA